MQFTALPYDANIAVNGEVRGQRSLEVEVEEGQATTVEVAKRGFANEVVVRTRIIVKRSNDAPLRYTVKIVSERNKFAGVSVKEDENFASWDSLLNTYKDVIGEMQSRMN